VIDTRATLAWSRAQLLASLETVCLLGLVAAAFAPLLEQLPVARESPATAPGISASLARSVPNGGVVLVLPYPRAADDEPMLWQAVDEMKFRIVGGYALVPGTTGLGRYFVPEDPQLSELSSFVNPPVGAPAVPVARACHDLRAVLRAGEVDAMVLRTRAGPLRARGAAQLAKLLGPPTASLAAGDAWYDLGHRRATPGCPADS